MLSQLTRASLSGLRPIIVNTASPGSSASHPMGMTATHLVLDVGSGPALQRFRRVQLAYPHLHIPVQSGVNLVHQGRCPTTQGNQPYGHRRPATASWDLLFATKPSLVSHQRRFYKAPALMNLNYLDGSAAVKPLRTTLYERALKNVRSVIRGLKGSSASFSYLLILINVLSCPLMRI